MKLSEQEIISIIDDKITEILTSLRDNTYRNSESRKELAHLIVRLCLSKDPRARVAARKIGDFFTQLGQELLGMYDENGQKVINESKINRWKSIFNNGNK